MKKYLVFILTSLFLLSGCAKNQSNVISVNNPYEIEYNGKILSYYDTVDQVAIDNFIILENNGSNLDYKDGNSILVNDYGIIRAISITDNDVITYKSISVGDDVKKIEDSFENVQINPINYYVLFNGNSEEVSYNSNIEDNWIWIHYVINDSKITRILIYDTKYSRIGG